MSRLMKPRIGVKKFRWRKSYGDRPRDSTMTSMNKSLALLFVLIVATSGQAASVTDGVSSGKVDKRSGRVYRAEIRLLASDLERMFASTRLERAGVDLSPAGVLESEIGKFMQRRVTVHNADGKACTNKVEQAGEDPMDATAALITLDFDCKDVEGSLFYDPSKLLAAHGANAQHFLKIEGESQAGMIALDSANSRINLSSPLPPLVYEEVDPKDLELGPRKFLGKPLKIVDAQCYYADLNEYRCWSAHANMTIFARAIADYAGKAEFDKVCGKFKNSQGHLCRKNVLIIPQAWEADQPSAFGRRTIIKVDELRFANENSVSR